MTPVRNYTFVRKSTWLKAALYVFSMRFMKERSTRRDLSIQTPLAAEIVGQNK